MYCPGLKQNIPEPEGTPNRPARPMTPEEIGAVLWRGPDPEELRARFERVGETMERALKLLAAHQELKEASRRRRRELLRCVGVAAAWIIAALVVWLLA